MKNVIILSFFLAFVFIIHSCSVDSNDVSDNNGNAFVGSYSTMLTINERLYAVTKTEIITFNIAEPSHPKQLDKQDIGDDIESLYHYNGLLFIGSANNMLIYSLDVNGIPSRQSDTQYNNIWGEDVCSSDPIVVRNDIAYVTLSSTNVSRCFSRTINELRIYDVKDYKNPTLIQVSPMTKPKGLGFGKEKLFVCDETDGLIVFDLKDPINPIQQKTFSGYPAYDIIVKDKLLIVSSAKSLYQYNISDENDIQFLAKIDL